MKMTYFSLANKNCKSFIALKLAKHKNRPFGHGPLKPILQYISLVPCTFKCTKKLYGTKNLMPGKGVFNNYV